MPEKRLVLLGGGHSHILLMKNLGMRPIKGLTTSLVTPDASMIYTGMLPGAIMGIYTQEDIQVDLVKLSNYAHSRLIFDSAKYIDLKERNLVLDSRKPLNYDMLSIDIGINYGAPKIKGFDRFVLPIKPFQSFIASWQSFLDDLGSTSQEPVVSLVGGGAAGCELALAMNFMLRKLGHRPTINLIDRGNIASKLPMRARKTLLCYLEANSIKIMENSQISFVSKKEIHFAEGTHLTSDLMISTAGGRPHDWLLNTELELDNGFIKTSRTLQSISHDFVFATGDCAIIQDYESPRAGVFAVKAAPILYQNLDKYMSSRQLSYYTPQKNFLQALTLEYKNALIFRGSKSISGYIPWLYKDFVDRSFLKRFSLSSPMNSTSKDLTIEKSQPMCGACGAKVGSGILENVLSKFPVNAPGMLNGIGDDAAILNLSRSTKILTTDHLRKFCEDPWKMARITAIHSLGDIWAMGAEPVVVLSHITLPESSYQYQENCLTEIMDSASEVFLAEGAHIVGGHTTKGLELMIGFTILGNVDDEPITIDGALPTDKIILTKPIGVGTILAGEMQGLAKGAWIKDAHDWMMKSQGNIARVIGEKATAMTDITGFGLVGHLMKICQASGLAVELYLDRIPILPGALDLTSLGVRSTLFEENLNHSSLVKCSREDIKWPLLFDPQTSGGLLAAIPEKDVKTVISELKKYGFYSYIVGEFFPGSPEIIVS